MDNLNKNAYSLISWKWATENMDYIFENKEESKCKQDRMFKKNQEQNHWIKETILVIFVAVGEKLPVTYFQKEERQ